MVYSAYWGEPPANERDLLIVKGIYAGMGMPEMDASRGLMIPTPPVKLQDSRAGIVLAGCIATIAVVVIVTGLRILSRLTVKNSYLSWDDFWIVLAAATNVVYFGLAMGMVTAGGGGKHKYNVTYAEKQNFHLYGSICSVIFWVACVFTKISVVCFNQRLTGNTSLVWIWVHRVLLVGIAIYGLFTIPWWMFGTNPVACMYSYIAAGRHPNYSYTPRYSQSSMSLTILHVILDWLLLAIPVVIILQLQMKWVKKLLCIIPLSIGCLSCVGAAYRIRINYHPPKDLSYRFDILMNWNIVDLVCSVIATSLPACFSLLVKHLPNFLRQYYTSRHSSHGSSTGKRQTADNTTSSVISSKVDFGPVGNQTKRDKYDQYGGINVKHDLDLESLDEKAF